MEGKENIAAALRNAVAAARIAARRSSEAAASAATTGHMGTLGSGRGPHLPGNTSRAPAALANARLQNTPSDDLAVVLQRVKSEERESARVRSLTFA